MRPPTAPADSIAADPIAADPIAAGAMLGGAAGRRGWDAAVPRIGAAAGGGFAVLLLVAPLLHRDPVARGGGGRELHAGPDTP